MTASRTMKPAEVRRAKVILQVAAGQSYRTISKQQGCGQDFVAKERLAGLYAWHRGKIVSEKIIDQEARILKTTKEARGIFTSIKDLERKIMRYIRSYNRKATPIKWSYKDASNRIKPALKSNDTVH